MGSRSGPQATTTPRSPGLRRRWYPPCVRPSSRRDHLPAVRLLIDARVDAPRADRFWDDLDPDGTEPGCEPLAALRVDLRRSPDRYAARSPRRLSHQIVHDERHVRIGPDVDHVETFLPAVRKVVRADLQDALVSIEVEAGGDDMRPALAIDRGQPPDPLHPEVGHFFVRERVHRC